MALRNTLFTSLKHGNSLKVNYAFRSFLSVSRYSTLNQDYDIDRVYHSVDAAPEPPKLLCTTPFNVYMKDNFAVLKNNGDNPNDVLKKLSEKWKNLPPTEKQVYESKFEAEKQAYLKAKEEYESKYSVLSKLKYKMESTLETFDALEKRFNREVKKITPKKKNGYHVFIEEYLSENKIVQMPGETLQKAMGRTWKELDNNEKEKYNQKAKEQAASEKDESYSVS